MSDNDENEYGEFKLAPERNDHTEVVDKPWVKELTLPLTAHEAQLVSDQATMELMSIATKLAEYSSAAAKLRAEHKVATKALEDAVQRQSTRPVRVIKVRLWDINQELCIGAPGSRWAARVFTTATIPQHAQRQVAVAEDHDPPTEQDMSALTELVSAMEPISAELLCTQMELGTSEIARLSNLAKDQGLIAVENGLFFASEEWEMISNHLSEIDGQDGVVSSPATEEALLLRMTTHERAHAITRERVGEILRAQDGYGTRWDGKVWSLRLLDHTDAAVGVEVEEADEWPTHNWHVVAGFMWDRMNKCPKRARGFESVWNIAKKDKTFTDSVDEPGLMKLLEEAREKGALTTTASGLFKLVDRPLLTLPERSLESLTAGRKTFSADDIGEHIKTFRGHLSDLHLTPGNVASVLARALERKVLVLNGDRFGFGPGGRP